VSRFRMSVSLLIAAAAGVLAVDGWDAARSAAELASRNAAWLLLALALLNLMRAIAPEGALAGPMILALIAGAIAFERNRPQMNLSPATVAATGLALLGFFVVARLPASQTRCAAICWVTRRQFRMPTPCVKSVVAVLGSVELDLTRAGGPQEAIELRCLVLGGRIELRTRADWTVELARDSSTLLVRIRDRGPEPAAKAPPTVSIRLVGGFGGFAIHRV